MPTGKHPTPGPLSRHVAAILAAEVARLGLRQAEVAARAGMSASQLSRALAATKVLTIDQLDALCRVLGLPVAEVVSLPDAGGENPDARVTPIRVRPSSDTGRAVARPSTDDRGGDHGNG